jgi:hypothetical protein
MYVTIPHHEIRLRKIGIMLFIFFSLCHRHLCASKKFVNPWVI